MHRNRKGVAFLIVLAFVLILGIASTTFVILSGSELRMARRQSDSTRAFYIAEGGFERAGYDLEIDDDWLDGDINGMSIPNGGDIDNFYELDFDDIDPNIKTSLGGEFTVWLKNVDDGSGEPEEGIIWIKAKGVYENDSRAIKALLKSKRRFGDPGAINKVITCAGIIDKGGSYDINPDPEEDYIEENSPPDFEEVFGVSKEEMEGIVEEFYPGTYYDDGGEAFSNDNAEDVTWIEPNDPDPRITSNTWEGEGIFISEDEGTVRITGGHFSGVMWITGPLEIDGNFVLDGAIFVESAEDIKLIGNPTLNWDSDAIEEAFGGLTDVPTMIELWQELQE